MGKYTIKKKFVGGSENLILKIAVLKKNKVVYYSSFNIVLNRKIVIDIKKFFLFMEIIKNITEKRFMVPNDDSLGLINSKEQHFIIFSDSKFATEYIMLEFDNINFSKEHLEVFNREKPKYADSISFKIEETYFELKISNDLIELFIELEQHLNYFL